jgi:hypothetical protein
MGGDPPYPLPRTIKTAGEAAAPTSPDPSPRKSTVEEGGLTREARTTLDTRTRPDPSGDEAHTALLRAQAEGLRDIIERARAAEARLDHALEAAARAFETKGREVPEDLRRSYARSDAARALVARSIDSFEHAAALMIHHRAAARPLLTKTNHPRE